MRKFNLTLILILSLFFGQNLFAQNYDYVKIFGGSGFDDAWSLANDSEGNTYLAGRYQETITIGTNTFTSKGGWDILLIKLNSEGEVIWAKTAGGLVTDVARAICIDTDNNIYIAGSFEGEATFETQTINASGAYDTFIAKYNSTGELQWIEKAGSPTDDWATSIALDTDNNLYVGGVFYGTAVFKDTEITSKGNGDGYYAKYNSVGNLIWVKQFGGTGYDIIKDITVFGNNLYAVGNFSNSVELNESTTITSNDGYDFSLISYSKEDGSFNWVKNGGAENNDEGSSVACDSEGNIYVAGTIRTGITFGETILKSRGHYDILVASFAQDGTFRWAKNEGGSEEDKGTNISINSRDEIIVCGYFSFKGTFGKESFNSKGAWDVFTTAYTKEGYNSWTLVAGGTGYDYGRNISIDKNNNIYTAGYFNENAQFDDISVSSNGGYDAFICKIKNSCPVSTLDLGDDTKINLTQSITLDAGIGYTEYLWNDNSTEQTLDIVGSEAGLGEKKYYVEVKDENACTYSDTIRITVIDDAATQNFTKNNVYIYPIQNKKVKIELTHKSNSPINLQVVDLSGKVLRKEIFTQTEKTFNFSNLKTGIYIININNSKFNKTVKIILK